MCPSKPRLHRLHRLNYESGFVLLVTLWVMVMLGVMVTTLAYQVRVEASVERHALDQSRLRLAARGAVHLAGAWLREHALDEYHSPYDEWWADAELWQAMGTGDVEAVLLRADVEEDSMDREAETDEAVESGENGSNETATSIYGPDDEESRLNINTASPEQLTGFPGIPTVLAEAIVAFRRELQKDQDSEKDDTAGTIAGGVAETESAEKNSLIQGPIRSLHQLLAVEGMNEELLFQGSDENAPLIQYLTTMSSGKVNVNSASAAVLAAAGLNEGQVNSVLAQRDESPFESLTAFFSAISLSKDSKKQQRLEKVLDVRSTTFRLLARANLPGATRYYHVQASLFNDGEALRFVRWQEY